MTKDEYLKNAYDCIVASERIVAIENKYDVVINDSLARVISYAGTVDFFDEERRALTYEEIIDADEKYGFEFVANKLIPVVDAYDNDYIAFSFSENKWCKVNVSDGVLFKKRDTLDEVL